MLDGISAMSHTLKSLLRARPSCAIKLVTNSASSTVRQNGIITCRFLKPNSLRTFLIASNSNLKAGVYLGS